MIREELTKRSPVRYLEASIHGGVGKGNLGVISSRKGVGKTACLVHIATDKLLQDKHVIHVSFAKRVDHILAWYEDIFREIAQKRSLETADEVHDDIVKNRVVMNFARSGVSVPQLLTSLKAMIVNGQTETDVVIVDGFDFSSGTQEEVHLFKEFAQRLNVELWFSDSYAEESPFTDERGIPLHLGPFLDEIAVILTLISEKGNMALTVVKDHEEIRTEHLAVTLDTKTLLIART